MIKELTINNLAIIKNVQMEFDTNFAVITGETGAGKSLVLDGISLLLGKRSNVNDIMKDCDSLTVEGVIEISDNLKSNLETLVDDIDFSDNELIIYRKITKDGKTKININGKRVTLATLASITKQVVDIVGQHENQYLLDKSYHLSLLDEFLPNKINLKSIVNKIHDVNKKIEDLEEEKKAILEKKDLYEFSINEISELDLYEGLDEELEYKYKKSFDIGRITEALSILQGNLNEKILPSLKECIRPLHGVSEYENIQELLEKVESARELLNEVDSEIYIPEEEDDIEEINDKLNKINKLKFKYAGSITDILKYKKDLEEKLINFEYSDENIKKLKQEKEEYIKEYIKEAQKLRELRKDFSKKLEEMVNTELKELNMKEASFKIYFKNKDGFYTSGIDDVEFMIRTNKNQDYQKLAKIASGGEISRIMLALKIVFSRVDKLETLVFDEIDAGISGQTVKLVADKLKQLSNNVQVICVTHSPNIAAKAREQFMIYKKNSETKIKKLNSEQRVQEIARIVAGDNITSALVEHVKEMMSE